MNFISSSDLNIQAAVLELQRKTHAQIQIDTARTWAARAIASYMLYMKYGHLGRLLDAEDYRHEAFEHASESLETLTTITNLIDQVRQTIVPR